MLDHPRRAFTSRRPNRCLRTGRPRQTRPRQQHRRRYHKPLPSVSASLHFTAAPQASSLTECASIPRQKEALMNIQSVVSLPFAWYDFSRAHSALRVTAAHVSKIPNAVWLSDRPVN
jgi:hypothetical protein